MSEKIGVSKVARLLGVKRADLNKRLLAAGIPTFEGKVDFEKVKCIAPAFDLGESVMLDRIQCIRENLAKPAGTPSAVQDAAGLADQVQKLSTALAIEQQMGQHYRQILVDMAEKLGELQMSGEPEQREIAFELCEWLRGEITSD